MLRNFAKSLLMVCCLAHLTLSFAEVPAADSPFVERDPNRLSLASVSAAVYDLEANRWLYEKRAETPVPIASITKLMTAMVVLDAEQPLEEWLEIVAIERESTKNAYSKMRKGSEQTRAVLLQLALMSSENVAAGLLAHYYPGGREAFIQAMNTKAESLGMKDTQFDDPSGLSVNNISSARDLVTLMRAANDYPLIEQLSTARQFTATFKNPRYQLWYGNTNRLVSRKSWDIDISKTGYLTEAGRCLALQTVVEGRPVIMVLLDSFGKLSHIGDAGRVKRWLTTGSGGNVAAAALTYEREKSAALK